MQKKPRKVQTGSQITKITQDSVADMDRRTPVLVLAAWEWRGLFVRKSLASRGEHGRGLWEWACKLPVS